MILVDTSVWIDHFRNANRSMTALLNAVKVATHPVVIGELACGNLPRRAQTLKALMDLEFAASVHESEVLHVVEDRKLWGLGIGWADAVIIASALVSDMPLWTLDQRLRRASQRARLALFIDTTEAPNQVQ